MCIKNISIIISFIVIANFASGCSVLGKSETVFTSQVKPSDRTPGTKSWSWTNLIDYTVVDSNSYDSNVDYSLTVRYPMSVVSSASTDFSIIQTRAENAASPATVIKGYITQPYSYLGNIWGQTGSSFIQLDPGTTSVTFHRPISTVDSQGNIHSVIFSPPALNGRNSVYHFWKSVNTGNWVIPKDVSDPDVTQKALPRTSAIAVNSNDVATFTFCQNNIVYYNQYEIGVGYRFSQTSDSLTTTQVVDSSMACHSSDYGMDLAFEQSDIDGIVASATNTNTIHYKMFDGHTNGWSSTAVATVSGSSTDRFPKIFIDDLNTIHMFFYRGVAGANTDIYYVDGTVSAGMNTPVQFDSTVGSGQVSYYYGADSTNPFPPVLAKSGNKAILLFIKSDGTSKRLWISEFLSTRTWSTPTAIDVGSSVGDVTWADAAINSRGQIIVAYSAGSGTVNEHVYARYRDSTDWSSTTQLDTYTGTDSSVAPNRLMPSVAISSSGNAMVTFTHLIGGVRRSFAASYHE